jgi:hypothetical protein
MPVADLLAHCYDQTMKTIPKIDTIRFARTDQVAISLWLRKELVIKE